MVRHIRNKKGVTLIELTITILVVAIIGATIGGTVIFFVQMFMFSPRQLNTQSIASELTQIMIEGGQDARGIRYATEVIDASAAQFSYTYGYPTEDDQLSVRFRYDAGDDYIYKSTSTDGGSSWSSEEVIPYYIQSGVVVDGKDAPSEIFTYKKAADAAWVSGVDALTDIERVVISLNVKTETGNFQDFHGSTDTTSSVEVKGF
ncbi:Tfp pilus assembly protein FimT/FimU [Candidatus Omnitrophota bacterium]